MLRNILSRIKSRPIANLGIASGTLEQYVVHKDVRHIIINNKPIKGHIPKSLSKAKRIHTIQITNTTMSGSIPDSLHRLKHLRVLDLSDNAISGVIPKKLGSSKSLSYLNLSGNRLLGEVPPELANLTNVTHFDLSYNELVDARRFLHAVANKINTGSSNWNGVHINLEGNNFHYYYDDIDAIEAIKDNNCTVTIYKSMQRNI